MSFEHLEYGDLRESSSRHLSNWHIKSKRLKQKSFAFVVRERAVLKAHGFEYLLQVRGDTKVREIAVHARLARTRVHAILVRIFFPCRH